ncbi:MAG: sterol desaturase family protein [Xanthomonadales bacterium]|nr:sterol desaturase family protein [Xanthomonadales bacterium]
MKPSKTDRIPEHMAPQKGDIRLFKNPLLERLSKISPVTVLAVYLPIIIFFVWKSFAIGIPVGTFIVLFIAGLAFWTLFEYFFHRYVFHFKPKGEVQKRISFLFHGVHHQYPNDKKRLVMPITLSLAVAVLLLSLTWLLYGTWTWAYSAGFTVGYLAYDMTHYSIHYFKPPNIQWLKRVWKSHIDHHYRDSTKGYGVSSAFWDRVFGTLQKPKKPLKTA